MQEAERSSDTEPRCRLCLQWIDGEGHADRGLQNIFTEDGDNLPVKIRDSLGVLVTPEDSIRTICTNCLQTVCLIDEFRTLCRQTEEIYESVQIRCEDSERWERYGEHVSELRSLLLEHKDTINERLAGVVDVDGTAELDSISQHFVPMFHVKKESENEVDCGDELLAMEWLEIKPERLTADETDEVAENIEVEHSNGIGSTIYEQQVKLAQEVLKRLKHSTYDVMDHKHLWAEIANELDMEYSATITCWNIMKQSYLAVKAGTADSLLKSCALFNLMNQIVPELDGSMDKDERTDGIPIVLKIAIAEEVRNSPELWDRSLASSTHRKDQIWKSIARKMKMDVISLKLHWCSLQDLYRHHKKRVGESGSGSTKADTQFYKLIETLHQVNQTNDDEVDAQEQVVVKEEQEENVLVVLKEDQVGEDAEDKTENNAIIPFYCEKMTLAKLVYKHQHLWNQKHQDFNNFVVKDATWDSIAEKLNKTREETKYAYKCLRDLYRGRVKRLKQGVLHPNARILHEPLFKLLELMYAGNMRIGSVPLLTGLPPEASNGSVHKIDESKTDEAPEDQIGESQRYMNMKLAVLCEKHEIIWNNKHPDHSNLRRKNVVWDSIARNMNLTMVETKVMWKSLRGMYRNRRLCLLKGDLVKNTRILRDPLYQKLNKMLKEHMHLGKKGGGISKSEQTTETGTGDTEPFSTKENKVRLVEEVIKHEFLWNAAHPDYTKSDKRDAMWTQISGMFDNCDKCSARNEWRRLRKMYRRNAIVYEPVDSNREDEPASTNRLYELFSKMAKSLTAENKGEPSGAVPTKTVKKRRIITSKRSFDDEGCIKVKKGRSFRYEKICELCGKQIERSHFEYHMNQHNGLRPYMCSTEGCGRQYSNKITRDRHEILVHSNDGYTHECQKCDAKFKNRSRLDYHYAVKHESQQIPCNVCGKLLKHKKLLRKHMSIHAGYFPCNVCGKVLQRKYTLGIHMRTHTNEKPYPCEICEQRFMLKVQMKTHLSKVHQLS